MDPILLRHRFLIALPIGIVLLLGSACDAPPPAPEPAKKQLIKWDVPPPKKHRRRIGRPAKPSGKTLAALGFEDSFIGVAAKSWCSEALSVEEPAYIDPDKVYITSAEEQKTVRALVAKMKILRGLLAPEPPPAAERKKEREKRETALAALESQVASLGKMAPVQLQLDRGGILAKLGRADEAKEIFYPMFQKRQFIAAEHGLQATCLLTREMWPKGRLFWKPWSEDELPLITPIQKTQTPVTPPLLSTIDTALAAVKKGDEAAAIAADAALRSFAAGRYYAEVEPVLAWVVLSALVEINPRDAALWEWRGVLAHRFGFDGAAKADAYRGCFLGNETACILAQWLNLAKELAVAGDVRHYWPLDERSID